LPIGSSPRMARVRSGKDACYHHCAGVSLRVAPIGHASAYRYAEHMENPGVTVASGMRVFSRVRAALHETRRCTGRSHAQRSTVAAPTPVTPGSTAILS
jgi:hypothetical protein